MEARTEIRLWVAGIALGMAAIGASPAMADAWAPDGGAQAWQNGTHDTLSVADRAADGNSVKAQWNTTSNELLNTGGNGTVAKKYGLNITAIRACTVKGQLRPDVCSSWRQ